jgi:iron(III)-enterobactin esterase
VAVTIANGGAERSMEYDTVSVKYADYVEAEVLPRAEKEANVKLTKDPEGRMTFGGSSGGPCPSRWLGSNQSFTIAC